MRFFMKPTCWTLRPGPARCAARSTACHLASRSNSHWPGVATRGDWKDPSPPIATDDATVVARLKAAGALLLGKLYMVGPSGTPPTRNPWNPEYSPGGSSSGSGAAVGARFVPFSLSEQTAGSGIRPAAYCGVAGLKPTYGRNSRVRDVPDGMVP
ncbi:MAG: amidase family protein [Dehalococcoidia bacterium]|nr:amidase family protein [Dehalococcoidia bacterium]